MIREIMLFLHSHGVGTSSAVRIFKTYGADAIQVISESRYRLARDIRGIGFRTTDQIARRLGIEPTAMIRAWAGIGYARGQFFTFLADRAVPPTNNGAERALRPGVIFRKVTNGFRALRGADVHALIRSVIGTGRLNGLSPHQVIPRSLTGQPARGPARPRPLTANPLSSYERRILGLPEPATGESLGSDHC